MNRPIRIVTVLVIVVFGSIAITFVQNVLGVIITGNDLNVIVYKVLYMAWGALILRTGKNWSGK